jgi:hypothetical protein
MLCHAGIGRVSNATYRAWITMLLMASQGKTPGAVGTVDDVAWMLHGEPDQVRAAVTELGGRIQIDGEQLTVRDWDDWQEPETSTERSRRHRANAAGAADAALQRRSTDQRADVAEPADETLPQRSVVQGRDVADATAATLPQRSEVDEGNVAAATDATLQRRGRNKQGADTRAREVEVDKESETDTPPVVPPADERPDQAVFSALAKWRGLGIGKLTPSVRGRLNRLTAEVLRAGQTPATINAASASWCAENWKGRLGQAPSWSGIEEWLSRKPNGHGHTNPHQFERPAYRVLSPEEQAARMAAIRAEFPRVFPPKEATDAAPTPKKLTRWSRL